MTVPKSLRAVVARRLSGLTASTQQVLAAAAVAGAEFELSTLGPVTGRSPEALLDALDEAARARLIVRQDAGAGFRFVHTVVRGVLYDGLSLAAKAKLHRKLADVIEARFGDARLPELAHHPPRGAVGADEDRAIGYAKSAGEQCFGLLAYEEAANWYARALEVLRTQRPSDAREGDLLLRCGEAHLAAGDLSGAREAYLQVAAIARKRRDGEQLASAALGLGSGFGGFEVRQLDPTQVELLEEALEAHDGRPSRFRARVLPRLSVALSFHNLETRRRALSEQAVAMAREVADPTTLGYALPVTATSSPVPNRATCGWRSPRRSCGWPWKPGIVSWSCWAAGSASSRSSRSATSVPPTSN